MAAQEYTSVVQQLYVSYFGRPADFYGLKNFTESLDAMNAPKTFAELAAQVQAQPNGALAQLVGNFSNSAESIALYGNDNTELGISKFVAAVYQNFLGREADPAGFTFWVNAITSGGLDKANAVAAITDGAMKNTTAQGVIDAKVVSNKLSVATSFTNAVDLPSEINAYGGEAAAATARALLKAVTGTTDLTAYQANVNAAITALVGGSAVGSTFTLTTNADNFVGTAGNDIFNAANDLTGTTAVNGLSAADVINGGAGVDSLNVTLSGIATGVLNGADVKNVEILNVRNVGTGAATVDASQIVGLTEVHSDRSTGTLSVTNMAAGAALGLKGNGVAALGNVTGTYGNAATAANVVVDGGTGAASSLVTVNGSATLTAATITGKNGVNALSGVTFVGTGVKAVTIDAQSNLTTGAITGLAAATTITVKGAGTANIGALQSTNVTNVDASANTGGVTATLNDVQTLKFVGGAGSDVLTTGALLTTGASVDAGAGTADRLVVANSNHITTAAGKLYKGFEQVQVQNAVTVDVSQLADNNTINTVRINDGAGSTGVTNLSAAQAAAVSILATGGALDGVITIGVKDASAAGQIDTVKAALTTTSSGAAADINLTGLVLAGVEKLELTGNGTAAATTGIVTLTTESATSLDSIIVKNAGINNISIDANHAATNLVVDASGSTGNTTINASAYATTTGAQLIGGSGNDVLIGSALADKIVGGAGNDVISGAGSVTIGTAATATTNAVLTAIAAPAGFAADVLTGGAGRDVFAFGAGGTNNTIANISTITDLDFGGTTLATGVDQIYFDGATAGTATIVTLTAAQQTSVTAAASLAAAVDAVLLLAATVNNVAQFTYGADTYVVINGATGNPGYTPAEDLLVKITGVAGSLDASDIVII